MGKIKAPIGCVTVKEFDGHYVLFKDCIDRFWFWMLWEDTKWKISVGYKTLEEAEKAKKEEKIKWH